jgi:hypothetical protein
MAASFVARILWNTKGVVFLPERTQLIPGAQPACLIILEHELDARLSVHTSPSRIEQHCVGAPGLLGVGIGGTTLTGKNSNLCVPASKGANSPAAI